MALSSRLSIRDLTTIATGAALAFVLGFIGKALPLRLPQGGSITLETIPILVVALRWGVRVGLPTGLLTGLLKLLLDAYIVHPVQLILDYPLPFALLGLSALCPAPPWRGILLGNIARFASHFASGVIFFGSFAPEGIGVWRYSALYNLLYIGPETLLGLFLVPPLIRRLSSQT